jgi:hypothetical protein
MTLLQPLTASTYAPNLCADVLLKTSGVPVTDAGGTTLSRFCQWTGQTAPVWDGDVCCNIDDHGAACSITNRGTCASGVKRYCKYGEAISGAGFVCYQPLPSACEHGGCGGTVQAADNVQEDLLCCENGGCWEFTSVSSEDCLGYFSWCSSGYLNEDGSVDCFD